MALYTRSQELQPAEQVKNIETFIKEWPRGYKRAGGNSNNKNNRLQRRDEYTQIRSDQLIDGMEQVDAECDKEHSDSGSILSERTRRSGHHLASRTDVHKIVETLIEETIDELIDLMINIAEQKVVGALKICDVGHGKDFIKIVLRSALNR